MSDLTGEDDDYWPPSRQLVDWIVTSRPGGTNHTLATVWSTYLQEYYPDDVKVAIDSIPSQPPANNTAFEAEPDGGTLLLDDLVSMVSIYLNEPGVEFTMEEFEYLAILQYGSRGIQISHHSTDIGDHWGWDWDTFIENVGDLRFGASTRAQFVLKNFIEEFEPRLSDGDIEMISFDSGSQARARIVDEELDGYFGSFQSNYFRPDFYKTAFVITDDRYGAWVDSVQTVDEDAVLLSDTSFTDEGVKNTVDATMNARAAMAPPETPEETLDVHRETFQEAADDPELRESIDETMGDPVVNFANEVGSTTRDFALNKTETLSEYDHLLPEEF